MLPLVSTLGKKNREKERKKKKKRMKEKGQHHTPGNALFKHQLLSHGLAEENQLSAASPLSSGLCVGPTPHAR